ncbi:hypothetical protein AB1N83_010444 [Pleurotus pulmonarius]
MVYDLSRSEKQYGHDGNQSTYQGWKHGVVCTREKQNSFQNLHEAVSRFPNTNLLLAINTYHCSSKYVLQETESTCVIQRTDGSEERKETTAAPPRICQRKQSSHDDALPITERLHPVPTSPTPWRVPTISSALLGLRPHHRQRTTTPDQANDGKSIQSCSTTDLKHPPKVSSEDLTPQQSAGGSIAEDRKHSRRHANVVGVFVLHVSVRSGKLIAEVGRRLLQGAHNAIRV